MNRLIYLGPTSVGIAEGVESVVRGGSSEIPVGSSAIVQGFLGEPTHPAKSVLKEMEWTPTMALEGIPEMVFEQLFQKEGEQFFELGFREI